jgi:transposase-like protein
MTCPRCASTATTDRPDRTEGGYRRFRCRACTRGVNERTGPPLNRLQYPTDIVALVVLWCYRYHLSLRDLAEMFLQRGIVFTREALRDWESKLAPLNNHNVGRGAILMTEHGCERAGGGVLRRPGSHGTGLDDLRPYDYSIFVS